MTVEGTCLWQQLEWPPGIIWSLPYGPWPITPDILINGLNKGLRGCLPCLHVTQN